MVSAALERVLPVWLARASAPTGSRDPLGLGARAGLNADSLLPGLSVHTNRARYYSFLCWSLREAGLRPPGQRLEAVHRLERMLVLVESLLHREGEERCDYIGGRLGRRYVRETVGALWELPNRILKSQTTHGALTLYRSSLLDFGLVEEEPEGESTLGLVLTPRGSQLADRYGRRVPENAVAWAFGDGERRRREATLRELGELLCLSATPDGFERRHFSHALLRGTDNAARRVETLRVLRQHPEFLASTSALEVESPDNEEDDGAVTESVDWSVLRGALQVEDSADLHLFQVAGAYELLALGANSLVASLASATAERGRLGLADWWVRVLDALGTDHGRETAGGFGTELDPIGLADRVLKTRSAWPEGGAQGIALLLAVLSNKRLSTWLEESVDEVFCAQIFDARRLLDGQSVTAFGQELTQRLLKRHLEVSERKGKAQWLWLDGGDLVRGDVREFRPNLHSMRFAQMLRLSDNVAVDIEESADEG